MNKEFDSRPGSLPERLEAPPGSPTLYMIYDLMEHCSRKGGFVIDIGAQGGQEALPLSQYLGADGHVYCFEPLSHLIKDNIERFSNYNFDNITVDERGVYCVDLKEKTLIEDHNNSATSSFVEEMIDDWKGAPFFGGVYTNCTEKGIVTTSLDSVFEGQPIDFIKSDAQGADPYILLGALNTLEQNRCPLILEWSNVPNGLSDWAFSYLSSLGYNIYIIDGPAYKKIKISKSKWGSSNYREQVFKKCLTQCKQSEDIYVAKFKYYDLFCTTHDI